MVNTAGQAEVREDELLIPVKEVAGSYLHEEVKDAMGVLSKAMKPMCHVCSVNF